MSYIFFFTAVTVALLLFIYSVIGHKITKSKFTTRLKSVSSLLAASIAMGLIIARISLPLNVDFTGTSHRLLYVESLVLTLIFCSALAKFVVRKYIIKLYRNRIRRPITPVWQEVKAVIKEGIERFLELKLHLEQNVTLKSMATVLCTNRTYLSAYINEVYKMSFTEWLRNLRLDHAEYLMMTESIYTPLKTIAYQCGFKDQGIMNGAFKKRHGISPGKWRESILGPRHKPYDLAKDTASQTQDND